MLIKLLIRDLNAKMERYIKRENIFKLIIKNESLHHDSNYNSSFYNTKNLFVKSTKFPHRNIHKYTWDPPNGKPHKQTDHTLIERRWHSSVLNYDLSGELAVILFCKT